MSSFPLPGEEPRDFLRLWQPEESAEESEGEADRDLLAGKPSASWSLSRFFERWFLPIVLTGQKSVTPGTVTIYRDAVRWWGTLTGDPPLSQIDDFTVNHFVARLREATYTRGKAGSPRPLSRAAQGKILRQIRAVLHRAGPNTDRSRPSKAIVPEIPHIVVTKVKQRPKPCITLPRAKEIAAAAAEMSIPQVLDVEPRDWWRALVGLLFYTGQRIGCILQLRWSHVRPRASGLWLEIPGEITKTGADDEIWLHPLARAAIERIRRPGREAVVPWPHHRRYLLTAHAKLQGAAGIAPADRLSLHAWRRAHADQIYRLGAKRGLAAAQEALGHASDETTRESYVDLVNELRQQMPQLWLPTAIDDGQRRLFE